MRRFFAHIGVSLDGFINDAAGQPILPIDEEFQRYIDELLGSIDAMVLGRVAFESLAAYWPSAGDEVSTTQARFMHGLPKYVLSTSSSDVGSWRQRASAGHRSVLRIK